MKISRDNVVGYVIAFMLGIAVGIGAMTLSKRTQPVPINIIPPEPTATVAPTITPGPIKVFVNGEVVAPELYDLPPDSRVEQAVRAAGGFTALANTSVVNLAQPLADGMQIYVPSQDEEPLEPIEAVVSPLLTNTLVDNSAGSDSALVNINTASVEELDALPGVGPSTAQKIIDFRETNGPFNVVEEIMLVPGIGESKFAEIEAAITVDN